MNKRDDKRDVSRYCKDRPSKDKVGFPLSAWDNGILEFHTLTLPYLTLTAMRGFVSVTPFLILFWFSYSCTKSTHFSQSEIKIFLRLALSYKQSLFFFFLFVVVKLFTISSVCFRKKRSLKWSQLTGIC